MSNLDCDALNVFPIKMFLRIIVQDYLAVFFCNKDFFKIEVHLQEIYSLKNTEILEQDFKLNPKSSLVGSQRVNYNPQTCKFQAQKHLDQKIAQWFETIFDTISLFS